MAQRYRDLEAPVGVEVNLPDSGAADLGQMLARAARGVQDIAYTGAANLRVQQGIEQGEKDGAAGKPKPKTGLSTLSHYGRAYNSAAEAAYIAKVQTDVDATLTRLQQDNEGDLQGFTNKAGKYASDLVAEVPEQYRGRVQEMLKPKLNNTALAVRGQEKAFVQSENLAAYYDGADAALSAAVAAQEGLGRDEADEYLIAIAFDNDAQIDALLADKTITPVQASDLKSKFRNALEGQVLDRRVSMASQRINALVRADMDMAATAMRELEESDQYTFEEKEGIRAAYTKAVESTRAERSVQHREEYVNVLERLARGDTSNAIVHELDSLYRRGVITLDDVESGRTKRITNAKAGAEKEDKLAAYRDMIIRGEALDPGDKDAQKAVTEVFGITAELSNAKPGDPVWKELATTMVAKHGIVPEQVQSSIRVGMTSQNPTDVASAASFYTRLEAINNTAFRYTGYDSKLEVQAQGIVEAMEAGIDPIGAVERQWKLGEIADDKNHRERLDAEFRKSGALARSKQDLNSFMLEDKNFSERHLLIFRKAPEVSRELQADFDRLTRDNYYLNGGDLPSAQKAAYSMVSRVYGVHKINGEPEVAKWAPQVDPDVARADIRGVLDEMGYAGDPDKIRLEPNSQTDPTKGAVWSLAAEREDGLVDVLRDENNRPVVWTPPGRDAYAKAQERIKAEKLQKAQEADAEKRRLAEQAERFPRPSLSDY